jgi:hypothetical protein
VVVSLTIDNRGAERASVSTISILRQSVCQDSCGRSDAHLGGRYSSVSCERSPSRCEEEGWDITSLNLGFFSATHCRYETLEKDCV